MTEPRTASLGDCLISGLIIFATLATIGVAALWMLEVVPAQRFRDTATEVAGRVTATSCDNRGTVVYAYSLGGRTYSGTDQPAGECDLVSVGDHVSVWYLPEDPDQSDLAPRENLGDAIELAIVTPIFLSAAAILILAWNNRRKREPSRGRDAELMYLNHCPISDDSSPPVADFDRRQHSWPMTAIAKNILDQLHLPEIDQVSFFKRDEVTTDLICCEVTVGDKVWFFHEEGEGWDVLLVHLSKLPGWRSDWFSAVSQPPFAECQTIAFRR